MSPQNSRRRNTDELGVFVWIIPLAGVAGGAVIGIPGIGLYVGLVVATVAVRVIGTSIPSYDAIFSALSTTIGHPFSPPVRSGPDDKWWPPSRLALWWSIFAGALLAAVPFVVHTVTTLHLPHHLTVPGLGFVSFVGYSAAIHAIAAAVRKDRPPVVIERRLLKEKSTSIASAAIVGASFGIIAFLGFAHASTIRLLFTAGHKAVVHGPSAYAGLGLRGAVGCSVGIAIFSAFAMASIAYRAAWLGPHVAQQEKLSNWEAAWLTAVGGNMSPPLFISEARLPEEAPEVCAALFQVPPGSTIEAYAAKSGRLASALGVETVSITPDVARDQAKNPMPGAASTNVFRVSYPLVPIAPGAHLSHEFSTKTPLYDYIVSSTFRRIFADLSLGEPMLWAMSILTTPDSKGRLVETMWMLDPGTTFDQVAKKTNAIAEKSGARWLRVGRRTSMYEDGEIVPGTFVSVLFGDPPASAEFVDGKVFRSEDHRRFIEMIDWDARFRSVGLASSMSGPTLVNVEGVDNDLEELTGQQVDLKVSTFTYPAGLSGNDVKKEMDALRASGLPHVDFRPADDPDKFQLLTADLDPLTLTYPFLKAAPKVLHRPVPGKPRLSWAVGVGPAGELVEFQFGTDDPHLLVAGMTGSGKSMSLISMLLQLATANDPSDIQFRIVDPKTALVPFRTLAHVTHFVMNLPGRNRYYDFLALLQSTVREMETRYERLNELNIEDFRQAREMGEMMDLPYVVVVVEEASLMLMSHDKSLEREIVAEVGQIANLGRGAGVFLVLATQYPSNQSIPNHLPRAIQPDRIQGPGLPGLEPDH